MKKFYVFTRLKFCGRNQLFLSELVLEIEVGVEFWFKCVTKFHLYVLFDFFAFFVCYEYVSVALRFRFRYIDIIVMVLFCYCYVTDMSL